MKSKEENQEAKRGEVERQEKTQRHYIENETLRIRRRAATREPVVEAGCGSGRSSKQSYFMRLLNRWAHAPTGKHVGNSSEGADRPRPSDASKQF